MKSLPNNSINVLQGDGSTKPVGILSFLASKDLIARRRHCVCCGEDWLCKRGTPRDGPRFCARCKSYDWRYGPITRQVGSKIDEIPQGYVFPYEMLKLKRQMREAGLQGSIAQYVEDLKKERFVEPTVKPREGPRHWDPLTGEMVVE